MRFLPTGCVPITDNGIITSDYNINFNHKDYVKNL